MRSALSVIGMVRATTGTTSPEGKMLNRWLAGIIRPGGSARQCLAASCDAANSSPGDARRTRRSHQHRATSRREKSISTGKLTHGRPGAV
jgi:hypothetical protein